MIQERRFDTVETINARTFTGTLKKERDIDVGYILDTQSLIDAIDPNEDKLVGALRGDLCAVYNTVHNLLDPVMYTCGARSIHGQQFREFFQNPYVIQVEGTDKRAYVYMEAWQLVPNRLTGINPTAAIQFIDDSGESVPINRIGSVRHPGVGIIDLKALVNGTESGNVQVGEKRVWVSAHMLTNIITPTIKGDEILPLGIDNPDIEKFRTRVHFIGRYQEIYT